MDNQRTLLERFILDNPELEKLEALISEFNIFDAIGMAHQEIRHSHFLAYLLNPNASHGLDDRFLKRFLMRILVDTRQTGFISPIEIDVADFSNAVVERETEHVDILIHDLRNNFVCIVENKIFSTEHTNQLSRYFDTISHRFPGAAIRVLPVFLSPDGTVPSDSRYFPLSYTAVAEEIERLRVSSSSTIGPDVNTAMRHYVAMLGRHIVTDSDIARLCQQIYQRHKAAIDLIVEHMPNMRTVISEYLVTLISNTDTLEIDQNSLSSVRFFHIDWEQIPDLNTGTGWANSNKILNFSLNNYPDHLTLYLHVGPGNAEVRNALISLAKDNPSIFQFSRSRTGNQWTSIFRYAILTKQDYPDATYNDLVEKIDGRWQVFVDRYLPQLNEKITGIWINR